MYPKTLPIMKTQKLAVCQTSAESQFVSQFAVRNTFFADASYNF